MDPDLVRQQEEAEREALAQSAKVHAAKNQSAPRPADQAAPFAPVFSRTLKPNSFDATESVLAGPLAREKAAAPPPVFGLDKEPAIARLGRFMSYGVAGGMLGGGLGIAAQNYWRVPMEQANQVIFGPAGALALFCAFASLFVTAPAYGEGVQYTAHP